uniref:Uncharacterized protein n=1 Tax=Panagrolaimus sp. PS1159 TaxID=55785 RepID=A0AC35EVU8_9BILA
MLFCGSEACARSHELRRQPPQPSSTSQKFCHLQRAGSLSSVPPGSSSPSLGSLTPSGSASPAHSDRPISRRKEHLQSLPPVQKSPSRVRFDLRPQQPPLIGPPLISDKLSRPKPPPSNPPPPPPNIPNDLTPPENIYETVIMPSQISSSSSQEFNRSDNIKRSKRRSKRKTTVTNNHKIGEENNDYIVSSESSDSDNPTEALPSSSTGSSSKYCSTKVCSPIRSSSADCRFRGGEASRSSCRRNNHYSNPPPEGCEKRCSSCSSSSSESDGDDVYLSHYLAASLSRPENLKAQNKGKMSPFLGKKQRHRAIPTIATPKTAKNKKSSNSNCIVS